MRQKKSEWSTRLENGEADTANPSGLSAEQADTDRRLRQLLGTAIADRYADFCRLSSGRLRLTVSRPLAGHALRELDSLIRHVLAVPLDARAVDDREQEKCRREARRMLRKMGFDDPAVQRAGDALKPRLSHRAQIERITGRLGLAPDSDVTKLWVKLNETYGRVHERSFHERLEVDDTFRAHYAQPFDTVIRALAVQLENRYGALMRRAKEIAAMPPAVGIKLFVSEIPGALQLHLYFYENLASDEWLPFLEEAGLLNEPLPDAQISNVLRLWAWPAGRYLVRMASSNNVAARKIIERALRALKSSTHPDVQRLGLDVIAALPADEAASLSDVIAGWLTPETAHLQASPHNIIAMLAGAGHVEAALHVTGAVFQVFERGGELTGFFEPTMYEHYLSGAVNELAKAGPLLALPQFCDLLMDASRMDRNLGSVREEDYSYYMVGSLEPGPAHGGDILSTLIRAIVRFVLAAVDADPSTVRRVLETLSKYSPRIFRRIELHTLARAPAEAADLADGYLTDTALIDAGWCREEYGELARAWLPDLPADRRQLIFAFIDAVPEGFLETWHASFEQYHGRKPGAEDDREFREITVRDLIWEWRDALPPDRRAALDKTVAEFGDPNARRDRHLAGDQPSLTRASMQSQPVEDTVAYLEAWRPDPALQTHTAAGLAYELREAAAAKQELFSAEAAKFIRVRPLFVRHLLDGLRQPTANGAKIEWAPCLELLGAILDRSEAQQDRVPVPGDDPDWSWTLQSAIGWLASALGRGADGVAFIHADLVRSLVFTLYHRVGRLPVPKAEPRSDRKHSYVASLQTLRGGVVELCVLFVFWQGKDPASEIGKAPREAFARSPELRSILEAELRERSPAGWMPRAVLGRYLSWLFYFGEDWLREQIANLFPANSEELKASAWLGHLQYDKHPIGELVGQLHPYYAEHIAKLGRDDAPPGYDESANRLVDFLMILYLREELPDDLLKQFCDMAPAESRRHAMWFAGRHMVSSNSFRLRAMSYWEERLRTALSASDPEPYRRELGTIGQFFFWDVDPLWLMDQLLIMLNGGFAPNDAIGVLDKLAKLLPGQIDRVVEVTKVMVKQPKVEAWIFAAQDQSLRKILIEGKASAAPGTASAVREIMSFLASRGNPSFLDLDD